MTRAAIYVRVSTEDQVEKFGLASQLRELRALAVRNGYTIPAGAEFVDDGYSGATLERPALTKLRDAVRAGAIDVVLIYDPDRLSRHLAHQLVLIEEIEAARVAIEWASGPRGNTTEGRLLDNVRGVIAEYEREKIRERTGRGRKEKARSGFFISSRAPYGYRFAADGKLAIHDEEAGVVRMMFAWLVNEQRSARSIVMELRRLGIRPQRGREWAKSSVIRILTSRFYLGEGYFNQREVVVNPRTGRKTLHRWRPREEWIAIAVPAIVSADLFEAAQQQLGRNRSVMSGRPGRFLYVLRGLLRCSSCGARLGGEPSHGRRFYRCQGRDGLRAERCRAPMLHADHAEAAVWEAIAGIIRRPQILTERLRARADRLGARDVEVRSAVDHLARELTKADREEQRLLDLYLTEDLRSDAVRERLAELAKRRAGLRERLGMAQHRAAEQGAEQARQAAIERWCKAARKGLDRLDATGRQRVLRRLIREITVRGRDMEIHGFLPTMESTTTAARCGHPPRRFQARVWRAPARARP